MSKTKRTCQISLTIMMMSSLSFLPMAALRTAAGGTSGDNGFHEVSAFLDKLATYVIYLAIPAGVLALIAAGGMLMAGNQDGSTWLARTAIGVGIVLLAKGIMA